MVLISTKKGLLRLKMCFEGQTITCGFIQKITAGFVSFITNS